MIKTGSLQS